MNHFGIPLRVAVLLASWLALAGCSSDRGGDPIGPEAPEVPNPSGLLGDPDAGRVAFVEDCAHCHTSRDGYDLAAFDFTPFDVVRRGLAHVDSSRAKDIAAHIESIDVAPMARTTSPFQPGREVAGETPYFVTRRPDLDYQFWVDAFGTGTWPDGLTTESLRAMDPAEIPVPLPMPRWSIEGSLEDWMPDRRLAPEVLDYGGGAVRTALDAYYASRSEEDLIRAVREIREARDGTGICARPEFMPCFEANRWMASLGGQHYLRLEAGVRVPNEVAQSWWDVGEAAIGLIPGAVGEDREAAFRIGARWLYLAFSVAPDAFREPQGNYMNTFLNSQGLPRLSLFVALRRLVGDTEARHPDQYAEDGALAIQRAGFGMKGGVTEFVFRHWVERLEARRPPDFVRDRLRAFLLDHRNFSAASGDAERWPRIISLRERLLELLG